MYGCSRERPLRLFEVLTRNCQSAVELSCRTSSALLQPPRVFTIPPRQRLSSPNRLVLRRRNFTHLINTHTHKEREGKKERKKEKHKTKLVKKRHATRSIFSSSMGPISLYSSPIPIRTLLIFLYSPDAKRSHRSQKHQSWPPHEDS